MEICKSFLYSQQAGQSLCCFSRFESKTVTGGEWAGGVLVGDVILILINKHASGALPPPPFFFFFPQVSWHV